MNAVCDEAISADSPATAARMWTSAPAPMPSAAAIPLLAPPRAAEAMTNVMSAPGTRFNASPATANARNSGKSGSSSTPGAISSMAAPLMAARATPESYPYPES